MILYPNAKINIGLNIINKRSDGYHNIETLFYPIVGLSDILEITEASQTSMKEYGIEFPGRPEENICLKAYTLLKEEFALPEVEINLYKKIPVGAGLGGGSSDGAHTILLLDTLFDLNLTDTQKMEFASRLGSDCPFFIRNRPMLGSGKGEILRPFELNLDKYRIKLVTPPLFISTAEAYRGVVPREKRENVDNTPLSDLLKSPIEEWRGRIFNDFEETLLKKYPLLAECKERLYREGALYASMSGSGSTLYGIFKK